MASLIANLVLNGVNAGVEADGILIHNATARSQGTFTCRAEAVETGEVKERSFRVTVQ